MNRFYGFGARLLVALAVGAVAPAAAQKMYDENTYRALASDRKAVHVGDIVTIQVYEQSSASTTTDTNSQRTNGVDAHVASHLTGTHNFTLSGGGTFDGGGTTQRANKLLVTLSVSVKEILPNGDMRIAGEQLLTVNNEQHKVAIEGRVRPQDVASDNTVLSTRVADAHIQYAGEGDLSDRSKRAWWRAVIDFLGF